MKWEPKNWPAFHHRINQMYHLVIAATLVPFAIVFLEIDSGRSLESILDGWVKWMVFGILLAAATVLNYRVHRGIKEQLESIGADFSVKKRLVIYFTIQKRRYLQLGAVGMVFLVGLWLTSNYVFVIAYLLVLVQFSLFRPSQDRVIRDLQFSKDEREQLRAETL